MIEVLLLCSSLMIVVILFIIYMVVNFKVWITKRDLLLEEKINKINESLSETQSLFNKDVRAILSEFKKILNQ